MFVRDSSGVSNFYFIYTCLVVYVYVCVSVCLSVCKCMLVLAEATGVPGSGDTNVSELPTVGAANQTLGPLKEE